MPASDRADAAPVASAKCIFMDCDGVIFDVNQYKNDAFRAALSSYPPDAVDQLVRYHKAHGGISRYKKFAYFFRELHAVSDPDEAVAEACARFSAFVKDAYAALQPRREAIEFARRFRPTPIHVVSGSDEAELRGVFVAHGIDQEFAGVHGSPVDKPTHMLRIVHELGIPAADAIMVGDGWGDFEACQALGVPFIFLAEMSEWPQAAATWKQAGFRWAQTWADLLDGVFRAHA